MQEALDVEREKHQTIVKVRTLLFKLSDRQRVEVFDGVEQGFCIACGGYCPNDLAPCPCLVGSVEEE